MPMSLSYEWHSGTPKAQHIEPSIQETKYTSPPPPSRSLSYFVAVTEGRLIGHHDAASPGLGAEWAVHSLWWRSTLSTCPVSGLAPWAGCYWLPVWWPWGDLLPLFWNILSSEKQFQDPLSVYAASLEPRNAALMAPHLRGAFLGWGVN